MDRTERFYKMDRLLKSRRLVTVRAFRDELGVSLATFKRDLEYMRDRFSAPIVYDRDLRGYRYEGAETEFALPGFWLSATEIQALLAIEHLIDSMEPGLLAESLEPLKARLEKALSDSSRKAAELRRRVKLHRVAPRSVPPPQFATVSGALFSRKQLHLKYHGRGRDDTTERNVSPQRLVHYRDNWYLDAWCHVRRGLRSFALDAMEEVSVLEDAAKEVADTELNRLLASGYGIFGGEVKGWAKLRFSKDRARWVSRERWHPEQSGAFDEQGRYVLDVPFADERELLMDILRNGGEVEVMAPAALRRAAVAELKRALERYE